MSNFWGAVQYILPFLYIKVWIAFARGGELPLRKHLRLLSTHLRPESYPSTPKLLLLLNNGRLPDISETYFCGTFAP